ncbi:putative secreted protein [Colletotrichum tanaceti]|uniref:Putative secreted protein n=1 Tax=Colletotrichum tanaceti TaxID=1306861 RepID=A0A4U6X7K1_9PEZI|nr:putative secreted protein [Colletotrichum tanaceti]TKW51471.1 putative secreted protein [Colletotrichum tanaceti]
MHIRSLASLAFVAFAAQAFAQQTKVFKRSITTGRDLGFMRRADGGYQPEDEVCNKGGNTCSEACGGGYQQCKSTDQAVHCYDPTAGETCCSTTSGNSCLTSFYCTHDTKTETFCCPNGMNLGDCATKHGVTGPLTSDVPVPTTTSVPSTSKSSTVPPTTSSSSPPTTTSSSLVATTTTTSTIISTSTTSEAPSTTTVVSTSFSPSAGTRTAFSASNGTTLATASTRSSVRSTLFPSAAATTTAASGENAGSTNGPAVMAVILGAAFVAALL